MPDMSPLVTIVIPTYNRLSLLKQAVASIIEQSFTDWELIIADDGSEDGTAAWIHSLPDKRIKVLELPHHGNIAAARNAGAMAGSGKWIGFLDSDDLWLPAKLESQLTLLEQEGKRWTYGGFEFMNEAAETISNESVVFQPASGWIIRKLITNEAAVVVESLLLERKLFEELGGFDTDPRLFCREDYEFTLRLALKAEVVAIPGPLIRIREYGGRTTKTLVNSYEASAFVYEHFISTCDDKSLNKMASRERAHELAEASVKNMQLGNRRKAIAQLFNAAKNGDSVKHLLSSVKHYFFKKKPAKQD